MGGSSTSDNVTPLNLMNIRRVAYDLGGTCCAAPAGKLSYAAAASIDVGAITALILEQLKKIA